MKECRLAFKHNILVSALLVFLEVCSYAQTAKICKNSGEYCVNRETSSGVCHVQGTTESPQLGINILGPYGSRKEGVGAMCNAYDAGSTDPNKCSAVAPSGVCDNKERGSVGKKNASPHSSSSTRTRSFQTQKCAVKSTIWTNAHSETITVTGTFKDDCHEPEDQGEVSIFDKSGTQVGTTLTFSKGYPISVPLTVPSQGHIEYLCRSHSSTQELQCKYTITEPPSTKADKDPCSVVYPVPDGADQWTNCVKSGASACGGPDQCACASTERLVEFTCTEGKYNRCNVESNCSGSSPTQHH
jgi:hypothetical protein